VSTPFTKLVGVLRISTADIIPIKKHELVVVLRLSGISVKHIQGETFPLFPFQSQVIGLTQMPIALQPEEILTCFSRPA